MHILHFYFVGQRTIAALFTVLWCGMQYTVALYYYIDVIQKYLLCYFEAQRCLWLLPDNMIYFLLITINVFELWWEQAIWRWQKIAQSEICCLILFPLYFKRPILNKVLPGTWIQQAFQLQKKSSQNCWIMSHKRGAVSSGKCSSTQVHG